MRQTLDRFCAQEIDVETLAGQHPSCACEQATSPVGSHGPIATGEILRLFLTSPTHLRVKNAADLEKTKFRASDLKRAYDKGLSVCRLAHASRDEIEFTARMLFEIQSGNKGDDGGVVGVVDFPVNAVRICPEGRVPMCAYETPLDKKPDGGYLRPSHGDVVNSKSGMSDQEKKESRDILFNQIMKQGRVVDSKDVDGCDLLQFLPVSAR